MTSAPGPDRFRYDSFEIDPAAGRLRFSYSLGRHRFTEQLTFGPGGDWGPAATAAARLAFLLAGISYYKTAAPPVIDLGPLPTTAAERRFLRRFVVAGLGEFAEVNRLDLSELAVVGPDRADAAPARPAAGAGAGPLVPFGGGIDSVVVAEEVRAGHPDATLAVMSPPGPGFAALEATAALTGLPVRRITREIDPAVRRSAELGFLNGHVPVTGILSAAVVTAAAAFGHPAVVMANEWSASAPTVLPDGRRVNHQWSKGAEFETGFADLLAAALGPRPAYFSLLRPYSELWVAQRFARLTRYHATFRSCNRAFHQDPARRLDRWCGRCDKCCFIDLMLAPFLAPAELSAVFGGAEPLDDPGLADAFAALVGAAGTKPFECVGDVDECRAALHLTARRPDRAANPLLGRLAAAVPPHRPGDLDRLVGRLLGPLGPHRIPDDYLPIPATGEPAPPPLVA